MMQERITLRKDIREVISTGNGLLRKLLTSLSPEIRESLLSHAGIREVETGEVLVGSGQLSTEVGYVIVGTLAMTQVLEHDRKHIVGLLVPTDIYGRIFDGPSNYQIEALTPSRIVYFPRARLEEILRQHPEAERLFLVHLLDEMDAAREWLLLMSGRKVANRLASFLMIMVRRSRVGTSGAPVRLRIPLSRKDLAHYLGTRPESLSRAFHELEHQGVLRILNPYLVEIADLDTLTDAAGDDLVMETPEDSTSDL
ncbi:MAG: Crp/Fnr family transcriptional regulator [Rhodobacter sp.]|nr:Crp/Fnr family transcriptional regulator [Rhodobacter sp.]